YQLAAWPRLVQLPRRAQRRADVHPAVDQYAGNVRDAVHGVQDLGRTEEGAVLPVVDDQRREDPHGIQVDVVPHRAGVRVEGDVRVLPSAPVPDSLVADRGVRIGDALVVGVDDALAGSSTGGCGENVPLARENVAHRLRDPFDL